MPATVSGPDRFHRITVNETTVISELIAPNSSMLEEPIIGVLGEEPTPAVKMSTSCWMRWSGLSMSESVNRVR